MKTAEVRNFLKKNRLDAIILFNKCPSFSYFIEGDFEHGMIILAKKENIIFLSPLYYPKIAGFKVVHWKKFRDDFKKFVKERKIKIVGVDLNNLLVPQKKFFSKYFKVKDVSLFLAKLRITKTKEELSKIRQACKITDMIFKGIISDFHFKREEEVARFIKIKALENDCEMAFEPIVASGRNAAVAHHESKGKLNKGFLVLDFGAKYEGYMSDMTRTIYLGKPSEKEKKLYEKVLMIQKSCIEKAKIGVSAAKLYDNAIALFGKDAKHFTHGLGHGFGVEIHELPNISMKSKDKLAKETVFTIEPGYYDRKKGVGIRIEDDIYLGKKKEVLTKSTKELISINFRG